MDVALLRRARAVFYEIVDLADGESVHGAIDRLCGEDLALREAVMELVEADLEGFEALDTVPSAGVVRALAQAVTLDDSLPERLGQYEIVRKIGEGGMGVVYEGLQAEPRRRVALKRVHPWLHSGRAEERFRSEVQAMADVLHPGIPQVYELFAHEGFLVVAMELVDGPVLSDAIVSMSRRERLRMLLQIARAVAAAHRAGVVHRDLKPANILLDREGRPKVLDFGIAQRAGDLGQSGGVGTLDYVAPEQLRGERVDERADVFALCVIGWEALFGEVPFAIEGQGRAAVREARQVMPAAPVGAAADLVAVLSSGLALDPASRMPSADALADELERLIRGRPVRALSRDPLYVVATTVRRHRWPIGIGLAAAAVAALAVWGGAQLSASWQRAALEQEASARLETVRRLAEQRGIDAPATVAAFESLIGDPSLAGTVGVAEGWLWSGDQRVSTVDRQLHYATAYVLAPDRATTQRARDALATHLASDGNWLAVEALRRDVDAPLPPHVASQLAWARWDHGPVDPGLDDGSAGRLAAHLLGQTRILRSEGVRQARYAPDGGTWFADGDRVVQLDGDGAPAQVWELPGPVHRFARGSGSRWVIVDVAPQRRSLIRLDALGELTTTAITSQSISAVIHGDADENGSTEVYFGAGYPRRTLEVAEPIGGERRLLERVAPGVTTPRRLHLVDVEGDGPQELLAVLTDWQMRELRVLSGTPSAAEVVARYRMEARDVIVLPRRPGHPVRLLAVGSPIGSAEPGARLGSAHHLVELALDTSGFREEGRWVLPREAQHVRRVDLDEDGAQDLVFDAHGGLMVGTRAHPGASVLIPDLQLLDVHPDGTRVLVTTPTGALVELGAGASKLPSRTFEPPPQAGGVPAGLRGLDRERWARADRLASLDLNLEAAVAFAELGRGPGPLREAAWIRALTQFSGGQEVARAHALARQALAREDASTPLRRLARQVLIDTHEPAALRTPVDGTSLPGVSDGHARVLRALDRSAVIDFRSVPPPVLQLGEDGPGRTRWNAPIGAIELDGYGEAETMDELLRVPVEVSGSGLSLTLDLDLEDISWGAGITVMLGEQRLLGITRSGSGGRENQRYAVHGPGGGSHLPVGALSWSGRVTATITQVDGETWGTVAIDGAPPEERRLWRGPLSAGAGELVIGGHGLTGTRPYVRARIRRMELRGAELRGRADGTPVSWRAMLGEPDALDRVALGPPSLAAARAAATRGAAERVDLTALSASERQHLVRSDPHTWLPLVRRLPASELADALDGYHLAVMHRDPALGMAMRGLELDQLDLGTAALRAIATQRALQLAEAGRGVESERLLERIADAGGGPFEHWLALGRVRWRRGDVEGARAAMERLLVGVPDPNLTEDVVRETDPELLGLVGASAAPPALSLR